MCEKLKAFMEGLSISNPEYWQTRSEKEINEFGKAFSNCMTLLERKIVVDALEDCFHRLKLLEHHKRAKMLDIAAIEKAEKALEYAKKQV